MLLAFRTFYEAEGAENLGSVPWAGMQVAGHSTIDSLPRREGDGASTHSIPLVLRSLHSRELGVLSQRTLAGRRFPPSVGHRGTDVPWEGSAWTLCPTYQPVIGAQGLPASPAQRSPTKNHNA